MSSDEDRRVPDVNRKKEQEELRSRQSDLRHLRFSKEVEEEDLKTPRPEDDDDETPTAQMPAVVPTKPEPKEQKESKESMKDVAANGDASRPAVLPECINATDGLHIGVPSSAIGKSATSPMPKQPPTTPVPPSRTRKRKVIELRCAEVRWFYQEPKGTTWIPFNGRDSLLLEINHRKEKGIELDEQMRGLVTDQLPDDPEGSERPMVVVLNSQYCISEDNTKINAIYWKEDSKEIRRGTWFTSDYQPLEMALSEQIERNHLQYFRGQMIPEGTTVFSKSENSNKPVLAELHAESCDIRWNSVIDVSLHHRGNAIFRYLWTKSSPLRRGYDKDAEWDDAAAEISHLILVVHGIGQKGYENLIAQNANQVRDGVVAAMEKYYPEEKTRPMFLPVEWRSSLILDSGITDFLTIPKMSSMRASLNSTVMDVMYYQSPLFRTEIVRGVVTQLNRVYKLFKANNPKFNGSVSLFGHSLGSVICYDVLTQYSPLLLYDKYVTESIDEFLESHSATQEKVRAAMVKLQEARQLIREQLEGGIQTILVKEGERLEFKVKYLMAVGSPLAVFLVMRGASSDDLLTKATNVERIFNIFHPYDPVAYRLEPFFAPEYRHIRPLKVFVSTDIRGRASYESLPLDVYKHYLKKMKNMSKGKKKDDPSDKVDARSGGDDEVDEEDECDSDDEIRSGCSSPRSASPPPGEIREGVKEPKAVKKGWFSFGTSNTKKAPTPTVEPAVEVAREAEQDLPLAERILGGSTRVPQRIDMQLQPGLTDKSYWSVFKSHFSYWTNPDLALFIANALYCKPAKVEEAKSSWA